MFKESILLLVISFLLSIYQLNNGLSFFFGALASFIPQVILILFVFFRGKSQQQTNKMTVLYQGEGLKFILTIVLTAIIFIYYSAIHFGFYFAGFLSFLFLNIVLPMIFFAKQRKNEFIN
ncbi:ATP synthase subunit I [Conservatibacter flavescens]|nr:ATP synthase subunit I [Conservatibacter flavescens]